MQDEEKERIKQERLAAYAAKKSKKPGVVAKSNVIFDVKPWNDSTDMAELEQQVRSIEKDGLVWGTSKLAPVAYGIKKLTIGCCVEDEKVSAIFSFCFIPRLFFIAGERRLAGGADHQLRGSCAVGRYCRLPEDLRRHHVTDSISRQVVSVPCITLIPSALLQLSSM